MNFIRSVICSVILTLCITGLSDISWAAIQVDSTGTGTTFNSGAGGCDPCTMNVEVGSGNSNTILFIFISSEKDGGGGDDCANSVTHNGKALTNSVQRLHQFGNNCAEVWWRLAPDTGAAYEISVDYDDVTRIAMGSLSLYNVKQQTPTDPSSSESDTTTITTDTANDWIIGLGAHPNNVALAPGSGQTEAYEVGFNQVDNAGYYEEIASAGDNTFTVTNAQAVAGVAIEDAAASSNTLYGFTPYAVEIR